MAGGLGPTTTLVDKNGIPLSTVSQVLQVGATFASGSVVAVDSDSLVLPGLSVNGATQLLVPSTDVRKYKSFSLVTKGTYNLVVAWQGSNDNATWYNYPIEDSYGSAISQNGFDGISYNGGFLGSLPFYYVRAICNTYTSGTMQADCVFSAIPFKPLQTISFDGADATIGKKADAAQTDPTQSATLIACIKGLLSVLVNNAIAVIGGRGNNASASGLAPLVGGGAFNATQPTIANGTIFQSQLTTRGALIVSQGVEGFTIIPQGATTAFVAAGTVANTVIKGSAGTFYGVFASTVGAGGGLLYDNATTNSGTPIGSAPTAIGFGNDPSVGVACVNGITLAGSATNPALTVFYR